MLVTIKVKAPVSRALHPSLDHLLTGNLVTCVSITGILFLSSSKKRSSFV